MARKLGYGGLANTAGARDFTGKAAAVIALPPTHVGLVTLTQAGVLTTAVAVAPDVATTAQGQSAGDETSHAITMPSGIEAGDRLLVFLAVDHDSGGVTKSTGDAWTRRHTTGGAITDFEVWERIADAGEGSSQTWEWTNAQRLTYIAYRITGAHPSDAIEASANAQGFTTTPNPGKLTPSWNRSPVLWIGAFGGDAFGVIPTTYPSGYSGGIYETAAEAQGMVVGAAWRKTTALSENPGAFTLDGQRWWHAVTVGVRAYHRPAVSLTVPGISSVTLANN